MPKPDDDPVLDDLLTVLKQNRGVDLHGYKRSSLRRRIERRMQAVGIADIEAYIQEVRTKPEEIGPLLDTILINVTSFFRDPEAWAYVTERIVPGLIAARTPGLPIRVWSAGCASGE